MFQLLKKIGNIIEIKLINNGNTIVYPSVFPFLRGFLKIQISVLLKS